MIIFKPENIEQVFTIMPRAIVEYVNLDLHNKIKDEELTYQIYVTSQEVRMMIPITHDFKEGENYSMEVTDEDGNLLWRGKGFVTEQTDLENYNVNE